MELKDKQEEINLEIERLAKDPNVDYLDAILYYCDKNEIEVEEIKSVLSRHIIEKLEHELTCKRILKGKKVKREIV